MDDNVNIKLVYFIDKKGKVGLSIDLVINYFKLRIIINFGVF